MILEQAVKHVITTHKIYCHFETRSFVIFSLIQDYWVNIPFHSMHMIFAILCLTGTGACSSNPCQNGAKCNVIASGYGCSCSYGYTGTNCQTRKSNTQDLSCFFLDAIVHYSRIFTMYIIQYMYYNFRFIVFLENMMQEEVVRSTFSVSNYTKIKYQFNSIHR